MKKGFELRNIRLEAAKKGESSTLDVRFALNFKNKFTKLRGEILEQSMAIISELNHFFDILDVEKPVSKHGEGYMDMWKLFRSTIHSSLLEYKSSTKDLRKNLHKAINIRDKYAHGDLGFINNQPNIKYKKGKTSEPVVESIDDEILERDLNLLENVKEDLRSLNLSLRIKKDSD